MTRILNERRFAALVVIAAIAAVIAGIISAAGSASPQATGRIGVDPTVDPSAFREGTRAQVVEAVTGVGVDPEITALLGDNQTATVRSLPNLTYVDITVAGPSEDQAIATVDAVMTRLIEADLAYRQQGPQNAIDQLTSLRADQEARLVVATNDAERAGLSEAIADTTARIEEARSELALQTPNLMVISAARPTSEISQTWLAVGAVFAGILLVGLAVVPGTVGDRSGPGGRSRP